MTRARNSANLASQGNLFVDIANDRTGIGSVVPAQNLHVAGTAGFHADTTFVGDLYNATWDRSDNSLKFVDSAKIKIGTDGDLEIYHQGNVSYIDDTTGNQLSIQSNDLRIRKQDGNEEMIRAVANGTVRLFYNGAQRLTTADYGVNVTGTTDTDGLIVSGVATVTTMNVTGVLTYDDVTSVDSVGIVTARQGVHIDDSIVHIGDTNTKIRFPTNDQIQLETAGKQWFNLGSTGSISIGNNSDTGAKLFIKNSNNDANNNNSLALDIQGAWMRIGDAILGDETFSNGVGIKFHNSGTVHWTAGTLSTGFYISNTSNNGNQLFPSTRTDALFLNSAGNAIFAGTVTATSFSGDGSSLTGLAADKIFEGNTKAEVSDTGTNGRFFVETEGTEKFSIASTGDFTFNQCNDSVFNASGNLTLDYKINNGLKYRQQITGSAINNILFNNLPWIIWNGSDATNISIHRGDKIQVGSGVSMGVSGNVVATGIVTATTFSGALSGNATSATTATRVTVTDQSSDTTCNVLFTQSATGDQLPHTGSNLTFDSAAGHLATGSLILGQATNQSKTQDGLIMERNSADGLAHITAGRSGGNYSGFEFYVAGASGVTKRHLIDYQGNFRWYGADGTTERFRITNNGKLITNTTGTEAVEFNTSNSSGGYLRLDTGANAANIGYIGSGSQLVTGSGVNDLGFRSANHMVFSTGGSVERLRINSNGQAFFTTTTTIVLDLNTTNSSGAYIQFDLGASGANIGYIGAGSQLVTGSATSDLGFRAANNLVFSSGGSAERLRIASNGNIGIGNRTSSPDQNLHVHTSSGDCVLHVEAAADSKLRLRAHSGESMIQFADASSSNTGEINYVHSGDYLKFRVNAGERLRLSEDTNGRYLGRTPLNPAESAEEIKNDISGTPDNDWYYIKQFGNVARLHYCVFKDQNGNDIAGGPWTMNWIAGVNPNQFSSNGNTSISRYLNLCKGIGIDKPGRGMESSRTTTQVYGAWLAVKRALWDLDPGFFQGATSGSGGVLLMPIMNINGEGGSSDHRVIYSSGTGTHIPPNQDGDHCSANQLFCGWWGGNDFSSWATNNNSVPSPEDWGPGDIAHTGNIGALSNSTPQKPSWRHKMLVTCIYK